MHVLEIQKIESSKPLLVSCGQECFICCFPTIPDILTYESMTAYMYMYNLDTPFVWDTM